MKGSFKMTLLGASALTLSACGEPTEEVLTYKSVEGCIEAGVQDESTCRAEFEKAQALHENVAPRYQSSTGCYSDFGYDRCSQHRTSTGSYWLPFMVGYMLAPRGTRADIFSQPLYRPSADPGVSTPAAAPGSPPSPATAGPRFPSPRSASPEPALAPSPEAVSAAAH